MDTFFLLLLAASTALLVLKLILELIILPNLHGLDTNLTTLSLIQAQNDSQEPSVKLDRDGFPLPIKVSMFGFLVACVSN